MLIDWLAIDLLSGSACHIRPVLMPLWTNPPLCLLIHTPLVLTLTFVDMRYVSLPFDV